MDAAEKYERQRKLVRTFVFDRNHDLFNGKRVLDVGCGRGLWSKEVMLMGARSVTAIDISETFVQEAHKTTCGIPNVEVLPCCDVLDFLPTVKPKTFDIILLMQTLICFPDKRLELFQQLSALEPECLLIFTGFAKGNKIERHLNMYGKIRGVPPFRLLREELKKTQFLPVRQSKNTILAHRLNEPLRIEAYLASPPDLPEAEVYTYDNEHQLNIYHFVPNPHTRLGAAIIMFHGGGWNRGSPEQFHEFSLHYAERGFDVFCCEYRVRMRHEATPHDAVEDAKKAIAWVRQHHDMFRIDCNKVVVGGSSAGAHISFCACFGELISVPNALILFGTVLDVGPGGFNHERFGSNWETASPFHLVRPGLPPALLIHETGKSPTPLARVKEFVHKMQDAGNKCTLSTFEGLHGGCNYRKNRGLFKWALGKADKFLAEQNFLEIK